MVDRTQKSLASLGTPNVRSHSPYCEATGPIVDEGFVAARIRELQRVYHQRWMPTQSHSPMSPCPIHPKLQKYEFFSRAEPYESPIGSSPTRTRGSGSPRSLRHNNVSAKYLSNSDGFRAWNRSADDLGSTKFLSPRYPKQSRKGYSASSINLNDSLEEQAQEQISSSAAVLSSTPPRASDRKEHESQTERRLLLKSNKGPNEHRVEMPKSGVGGESSAATRSAAYQRNESKEGLGLKYNIPTAVLQPAERKRISKTPQDQLADTAPSQATNFPLSSLEHPRHSGLPAAGVANQDMGEHITSILPQKQQQKFRPKGGYGDLTKPHAQLTDATRVGSDADSGLHAEVPTGISSDLSNTLSRAGRGNPRRQSLPARLGGPNRHSSSASTKTPSVVSSTRSSSLWKKWRSWKLVLVDKTPSLQDLSNGPKDLSPSSVNEIMNQPPEVNQANLDHKFSSPYMQPTQSTRSTRKLPEIRRAAGVDEREARFSVEIVPQTQLHQPPKSAQDVSGTGASRGSIPANTNVKVPAATPQPFEWVATLPLDETLQDSNTTSLFRAGADDFGESTDSTDASRSRKIKRIQIVISFDEVADLVIEAHLKGKQTAQ